jgi:hypothetical protein
MKHVHVFTSAAGNYLPKVRMLFQSLRAHRPDWTLHLAVADAPLGEKARAAGADEVHELHDLGIPAWRRWAFCHTLVELATAIKPFALRKLLARPDCEAVLYLDPDIVVFSALDHIVESLTASDILLTPHQTAPESGAAGIVDNEVCTMQHGIYNLGFIGVAARTEGRAFADFWADRLYRFGRDDIPNGIYTDQRWVDLVPAYFERVEILRGAGLNVAPWNLSSRRLRGTRASGFTVNGEPLGFFHFSQVDLDVHDQTVRAQEAAVELFSWYRRETESKGAKAPWGLGCFEDGAEILPEQRLVYRLRDDVQRAHPDPYRSGRHSFSAWWKSWAPQEYPRLFDPGRKAGAMRELSAILTYRRIEQEIVGDDELAPATSKVASA